MKTTLNVCIEAFSVSYQVINASITTEDQVQTNTLVSKCLQLQTTTCVNFILMIISLCWRPVKSGKLRRFLHHYSFKSFHWNMWQVNTESMINFCLTS